MSNIESKLKALEKLDKAATPGPWMVDQPYGSTMKTVNVSIEMDDGTIFPAMDWVIGHMQVSNCPRFREDASLIATYRNETPKLIQALREAVSALNYVADHENIGRSVYSDTDPERARQALTNIEKILGDKK